jgi:membrane protein YqaA with SNARE-associated domain
MPLRLLGLLPTTNGYILSMLARCKCTPAGAKDRWGDAAGPSAILTGIVFRAFSISQPFTASIWAWLLHLRGLGQIMVGIADNSVIPLPGSTDVFTIWLAASRRELWFYYAIMATVGSVVGGYLTYFLARRGGKEALERKLRKKRAQRLYRQFERWGIGAVAIPALLPPPFPIVPSLIAAGALQLPPKKFLGALGVGRGIRFTIIAGLGAIYGDAIVNFFARYYKPTLLSLIGLAVLGSIAAVIGYYKQRKPPPKNSGLARAA